MLIVAPLRLFLTVLASLVLSVVASAQKGEPPSIRYPIPDKLERATKADEKGFEQWVPYPEMKCPTCSGTGKTTCATCFRFPDEVTNCPECKRVADHQAVCRTCGGAGHLPDPLEKAYCPGCMGVGFFPCTVCAGGGRLQIGGAKNWSDCPACRGPGSFKCGVCNGQRFVEGAGLKGGLKDAPAAALQKAMATTDAALAAVGPLEPKGGDQARKDVKALLKAIEPAGAVFPPLKRLPKTFEDYMGKIYAGNQFQGHAESQAHTIDAVRKSVEFYLKHQKRMMELSHKRAVANEKLAAEAKGK